MLKPIPTLFLIALVFVVLRLPVTYRQEGGEDEEFYAVPGWTVATEGVPRVPYVPARDHRSWFYRVDTALFAMPPAYFYWQAPFYRLLPAGYGTARLASAVAGLVAVWLVFELGRQVLGDETVGLWAAALYSLSRTFFFPAVRARPDMLCGMLGLAALLAVGSWQATGRWRRLALAGALLGLGLLTHPFAFAYCLQIAGWVAISASGVKRRLTDLAVLTGSALATFALWTPLIVRWPELFREQFVKNVIDQAGPGLLTRMLLPWESLVYHYHLLLEYAQPLQLGLMATGLVAATWLAVANRRRQARLLVALAWSAVYLLVTVQGPHGAKGYWCYPAALVWLCVAFAVVNLGRWLSAEARRPRLRSIALGGVLAAAMLPGLGLRTWWTHARHWNDVDYNAPRFARELLGDLPPDARLVLDEAFVFDAYLAGRNVALACNNPFYYESAERPYDYLVITRLGRQKGIAASMNGRLLREYGDPHDLFACYAQVYVPAKKPP
ncbi:MAG TPA: glycosyltransferase family 39 protein [Pirellulales bacterium]|nr:glycosyltransferase family 39 protein [Pirellulales bacterium]